MSAKQKRDGANGFEPLKLGRINPVGLQAHVSENANGKQHMHMAV